ncbi:hypothetical protein RCL1_008416 [Eukaryota sp. TZLM3-RCL]
MTVTVTDGNHAYVLVPSCLIISCAQVAYFFTESAIIFPISPSTPAAEYVDVLATKETKNLFGQTVLVQQMNSEAGALLMVPNMYKWVGELLPAVVHIASRSIATHALSIFGDQSDLAALRPTGMPILLSFNVQESADFAAITHMAALKASFPFIHSYDGKRTSDELVDLPDGIPSYEKLKNLAQKFGTYRHIQEFRDRALDPERPYLRGTSQDPSVFFQQAESANPIVAGLPTIVQEAMDAFAEEFGRQYHLYEWSGPKDAEAAIIVMSSAYVTCSKTLPLIPGNRKVGVLGIRLYRPFCPELIDKVLPKTVKKIVVLDKCKEATNVGEPLFTDMCAALTRINRVPEVIIGGRYGISSKDFTPAMVISVVENLYSANPKHSFTVGINDDVTNLSLPVGPAISYLPRDKTTECLFYGLGGDGSVSAAHQGAEIVVNLAGMHCQLYSFYDAVKNGTTTVSHLRLSEQVIDAPYGVYEADYIGCHNNRYLNRFLMVDKLRQGGTFVVNCAFKSLAEFEANVPNALKRTLAQKQAKVFLIDASHIAKSCGNPGRTNIAMQTAFFKLSGMVKPASKALELLRTSVVERYKLKGQHVMDANLRMIDASANDSAIIEVNVPQSWANLDDSDLQKQQESRQQYSMITALRGNELPVSSFQPGGILQPGTTDWAKRGMALQVPHWESSLCIQCNTCGFVCPHAVIRPFLLSDEEVAKKPEGMETLATKGGGELKKTSFRIQISPYDCTGCSHCAKSCPSPGCLTMKPIEEELERQGPYWDYCRSLPNKGHLVSASSMKGAVFQQPLLEFHGACAGCGEGAYYRLLTNLYGPRLVIANATGCTSIWAGSYPSNPFTVNEEGHGPAWANSLFEDNAEFGLGMYLASLQRRNLLLQKANDVVNTDVSEDIKSVLAQWIKSYDDHNATKELSSRITALLGSQTLAPDSDLAFIYNNRTLLDKKAHWIIGGDGWSYDIGFGGLDHVVASGNPVKILIVDTEVYSNTGGQTSKATQRGAIHKFAMGGKQAFKKDLGRMLFAYENTYVASIALGANYAHTVKVLREAEEFPGPAVVIAYSPCIEHIYVDGMSVAVQNEKLAVDTGYWLLYRFDPRRISKGLNPLQLDSPAPSRHSSEFLDTNGRFRNLLLQFPEKAKVMRQELHDWIEHRYKTYSRMATPYQPEKAKAVPAPSEPLPAESIAAPKPEPPKPKEQAAPAPQPVAQTSSSGDLMRKLSGQLLLAWGSETGTVEEYQEKLVSDLRKRKLNVVSKELNDVSINDLKSADLVLVMVSSTGGGEVPSNAEDFLEAMTEKVEKQPNCLAGVRFALFGFGAKTYADTFQFGPNKIWNVLKGLGAQDVLDKGEGDADAKKGGIDVAYKPWIANFSSTFLE